MHSEQFDIITNPQGGSTLSIRLACATAMEHYTRTQHAPHDARHSATSTSSGQEGVEEACSTGLRVYEGAQVLAAFLFCFGRSLMPPSAYAPSTSSISHNTAAPRSSSPRQSVLVELGCGCGLAGFVLSHVLRSMRTLTTTAGGDVDDEKIPRPAIIFSDASLDCLSLVRSSGELSGMPVVDGSSSSPSSSSSARELAHVPERITFPLEWSEDGIHVLQQRVTRTSCAATSLDVVFGSDLLYYRVDVEQLMRTCVGLLHQGGSSSVEDGVAEPRCVVLAHYMRIPDGQRLLARHARAMGLHVANVPLTAFLSSELIHERCWGGFEVVCMATSTTTATKTAASGDDASEAADVEAMKAIFSSRASALISCGAADDAHAALALASSLLPYPSTILNARAICSDVDDAANFLHTML